MSKDIKIISKEFAKGNMQFCLPYLSENIRWNILGEDAIIGKDEVLEVSKMKDLESYPEITFKNIIAEGNFVVIESEGKATIKTGQPYNQMYCEIFRFDNDTLEEITTYLDTRIYTE
jgi:uncharacterized protein